MPLKRPRLGRTARTIRVRVGNQNDREQSNALGVVRLQRHQSSGRKRRPLWASKMQPDVQIAKQRWRSARATCGGTAHRNRAECQAVALGGAIESGVCHPKVVKHQALYQNGILLRDCILILHQGYAKTTRMHSYKSRSQFHIHLILY